MKRFIEGEERGQGTLLPEHLDDYVAENNPVRVVDVFVVAIDGSKFKAVNSSDRNFTDAKLKRRMAEIEANISRYLAELDTADRQEPATAQSKAFV
jgi:transposase